MGTAREKVAKKGFWVMQKLDHITASAVAAGAYQKFLDENKIPLDFDKPNKEAIRYAQLIVRRSQSTGQFKDTPLAVTSGKFTGHREIDRAIFQYQNFMLNQFSVVKHELHDLGIKAGNPAQAANVAFWLLTTVGAETMFRLGLKEIFSQVFGNDDEPDDFLERYLFELLQTVPFIGPLMGTVMYQSFPVPMLDALVNQPARE